MCKIWPHSPNKYKWLIYIMTRSTSATYKYFKDTLWQTLTSGEGTAGFVLISVVDLQQLPTHSGREETDMQTCSESWCLTINGLIYILYLITSAPCNTLKSLYLFIGVAHQHSTSSFIILSPCLKKKKKSILLLLWLLHSTLLFL